MHNAKIAQLTGSLSKFTCIWIYNNQQDRAEKNFLEDIKFNPLSLA